VSWRQLDERTKFKLNTDLPRLRPGSIEFFHPMGDKEAENLARQLGSVFWGWKVGFRACTYSSRNTSGIRIPPQAPDDEAERLAVEICRIFGEAQITATRDHAPMPGMSPKSGDELTAPIVKVFVGRKKPPPIE